MRRLFSLLAVIAATSGCAGVLAALPKATAVVVEVTAILTGINTVVQEFFSRHPDTPLDVKAAYVQYYDGVIVALTEYQRVVEATDDLANKDAVAAFAKFQKSYEALMSWLETYQMRNAQGQLLLQGRVISEIPPAASFKR